MDHCTARLFKRNVLPHDSVVELFKRFELGDMAAKNELVECNMRLVASIAKMYRCNVPFDDLVQEGSFGLIRSIEKFNWKLGFKFSTYARFWIKQAIQQHVERSKRIVRLPAHAIGVQSRIRSVREEYMRLLGVEPTIEEMVDLVGASRRVIEATIDSSRFTVSIVSNRNDVGPSSVSSGDLNLDTFSSDIPSPFDVLDRRETIQKIRQIFDALPPREQAVLRLRFGISDEPNDHERNPITSSELRELDGRSNV